MADPRRLELEELVNRPGTYFNPQVEVLLVVDDSPEMDAEIFNMEEFEGAEWVLVADESPIDEPRRDELLERFQVTFHPGGSGAVPADEDDLEDEEDELDADEPDELEPEEP